MAAGPTITPVDATFGAVITGISLADLDDATWAPVEAAFHQYGLLIFPGQHLSGEAQAAFGGRFGRIEELVAGYKAVPVANKKADGTLMSDDDYVMKVQMGNEGWHTDSSYMPLSAKASILSAREVPSEGGQTEWADMRAAYDALDGETRDRIEGLTAYHSFKWSQMQIGHDVSSVKSYGISDDEPPLRPLVKTHPVTGRKSLFIGRHAYGIPGLEETASKTLLADLMAFACQRPRTWQHAWSPGDVAVWDNRCLLHRARPYDHSQPRVLLHVRISGERETELALNA